MTRLKFPAHYRSPHQLTDLVAGWHGISAEDLAGRDPMPRLTAARQDLILILSEFTGLTQDQIGVALGERGASTISSMYRNALAAVEGNHETRLRMHGLRGAAMALPGEVEQMPADDLSASAIARDNIAPVNRPVTAFERMATSVVAAVEILRTSDLSDADARHAAFCVLTRPRTAPPVTNVIPMKGTA
ncbi:MAG: hypothetical protein BGP11_08315 [Rhodobacterales bacterium 65-51]|uniref:hypothetical protein n=1 Tax=uncultured Gemmobacter sp. TaxID=1095917 RepID=UPI00095CE9FB|nr:hypothetical protein [uncultured Gemmobacter sp.]OJY36340.1 MAG: hypothetical protein BGP11_08315 [Rhodobacterales bacterium 65-51]